MPETDEYPYETRLNIYYKPLELIEEKTLADACEFRWYNQTLCQVNESVVRLGVIEGEYHWHKHDADDEFFYVVEGKLLIDLKRTDGGTPPETGVRRSQRGLASNPCAATYRDPHGGECRHCPYRQRMKAT